MSKPNAAQRRFNTKLAGTTKNSLRRAQQIASQRSFIYDGSLVPTCLRCGRPREDRHAQKCDRCERS